MSSGAHFHTTRWSIVLGSTDEGSTGRAALEELCRTYWYPLYALARRRGAQASEAEDLVQGFFADLLTRGGVGQADPELGRFRGYLATAFRNFQANVHDRAKAQKRGGNERFVDLSGAEDRYAEASGRALEPEALFDRAWALSTIDGALANLRADYEARGKLAQFETLQPAIVADGDASRAEMAAALEMTDGALRVAIHRLRERYREALRAAVRDTVDGDDEVDLELARLFQALGG